MKSRAALGSTFQTNTSCGSVVISCWHVRLTVHWVGQPCPLPPKPPSKGGIGSVYLFAFFWIFQQFPQPAMSISYSRESLFLVILSPGYLMKERSQLLPFSWSSPLHARKREPSPHIIKDYPPAHRAVMK